MFVGPSKVKFGVPTPHLFAPQKSRLTGRSVPSNLKVPNGLIHSHAGG